MPDRSPYAALGARLRALRKQTPLRQLDLANACGVSHAYPSALEAGKYRPDPALLRCLVRTLHAHGAAADYAELAALAGFHDAPAALAVSVTDAAKADVLRRLSGLPLEALLALEEIARHVEVRRRQGPDPPRSVRILIATTPRFLLTTMPSSV